MGTCMRRTGAPTERSCHVTAVLARRLPVAWHVHVQDSSGNCAQSCAGWPSAPVGSSVLQEAQEKLRITEAAAAAAAAADSTCTWSA
jgi:hypothetical protein